MRRKLDFKELAEIEASRFFDPIGVVVRDYVVEAPQFPQSKFYYWKNRTGSSDLILFVGDDQPAAKSYDLANCVLDVAERLRVQTIYTCAAAIAQIHHSEQPRVWGVATNRRKAAELKKYDLVQRGDLHISGLNGLVLGVAKERNIDGVCLLGEVPAYATRIQNPMAALSVLKVLARVLEIEIDTTELVQLAVEARERMKELVAEAMGEYIDRFTEPIWERAEEDEDDEEDED